jgi:hypothetical protein
MRYNEIEEKTKADTLKGTLRLGKKYSENIVPMNRCNGSRTRGKAFL